jgi:hypothetical protein
MTPCHNITPCHCNGRWLVYGCWLGGSFNVKSALHSRDEIYVVVIKKDGKILCSNKCYECASDDFAWYFCVTPASFATAEVRWTEHQPLSSPLDLQAGGGNQTKPHFNARDRTGKKAVAPYLSLQPHCPRARGPLALSSSPLSRSVTTINHQNPTSPDRPRL